MFNDTFTRVPSDLPIHSLSLSICTGTCVLEHFTWFAQRTIYLHNLYSVFNLSLPLDYPLGFAQFKLLIIVDLASNSVQCIVSIRESKLSILWQLVIPLISGMKTFHDAIAQQNDIYKILNYCVLNIYISSPSLFFHFCCTSTFF